MTIQDYRYNQIKAQLDQVEEVYTMKVGNSKWINITPEQLEKIAEVLKPVTGYKVVGHYPNENGLPASYELSRHTTREEAEAVAARHQVPYAQETYTIEEVNYNV